MYRHGPMSPNPYALRPDHPDFRAAEKICSFLGAMSEDEAVGTWAVVERLVPREKILSRSTKKCRQLCWRIMRCAEDNGYIRRLPAKIPSSAPNPKYRRLIRRETAWVITSKGRELLGQRSDLMKRKGVRGGAS